MLHESAGVEPGRGRAEARLAVVETEGVRPAQLRRLEEPGQPKTHLENCTGRDKTKTETKTASNLFQPVLGDRLFAKNWHWFVFLKGNMSARSSEQERRVDARALIADEGRDKLRKASGSRK